jgi:hypothetical protein
MLHKSISLILLEAKNLQDKGQLHPLRNRLLENPKKLKPYRRPRRELINGIRPIKKRKLSKGDQILMIISFSQPLNLIHCQYMRTS